MADDEVKVSQLSNRVARFVKDREWEQFHTPKDLAAAISIESAELMELFLWKAEDELALELQDPWLRRRVEEELADVVILSFSLANRLEIDIAAAVEAKLAANEAKYPVDVVRGKAHKYTYYERDSTERD